MPQSFITYSSIPSIIHLFHQLFIGALVHPTKTGGRALLTNFQAAQLELIDS